MAVGNPKLSVIVVAVAMTSAVTVAVDVVAAVVVGC